eukprot:scaffold7516_cov82-Skeletonema_dohrnii-CCMP3373.AAC.1
MVDLIDLSLSNHQDCDLGRFLDIKKSMTNGPNNVVEEQEDTVKNPTLNKNSSKRIRIARKAFSYHNNIDVRLTSSAPEKVQTAIQSLKLASNTYV